MFPDLISRGGFIRAAAALAVGSAADTASAARQVPARLRVGVLSDVHVGLAPKSADLFAKALVYFRERRVDAVIVAGDLTDTGLVPELENFAAAWRKVFPDGKGLDGQPVEKLFVWGNHDYNAWAWGGPENAKKKYAQYEKINADFADVWKRVFGEEYGKMWIKDVKGYKFVGCQYQRYPASGPDADFLERHRGELAGPKPFFYIQHYHPKGTAPYADEDGGASTKALSAFPNAVAFTGHSHTTLVDDRTIWQGEFTSVGTAALHDIIPFGGRENSFTCGGTDPYVPQMPSVWWGHYHHGMLMTVYDDRIVLERRDFANDIPLAADWVIPLPFDGSLRTEIREPKAPVPQFPDGAAVTVSDVKGKDRAGVEREQKVVSFPNVFAKDGARPFDFTVSVEVATQDAHCIHLTKAVYSPRFCFGEAADEKTVTCVFSKDELPKAMKMWGSVVPAPKGRSFRFVVCPRNCYGRKGKPILSAWMSK